MLEIQTRRVDPDIVVVAIAGKIVLGRESQQLESATANLIREEQKKVILDLSGVTRIDSTGVGMILMSANQMKKAGGQLRLAGATEHVQQVLKLASVHKLVPLHPTADAAAVGF
jgi:anti-sigma B factor antagonist